MSKRTNPKKRGKKKQVNGLTLPADIAVPDFIPNTKIRSSKIEDVERGKRYEIELSHEQLKDFIRQSAFINGQIPRDEALNVDIERVYPRDNHILIEFRRVDP